MLLGNYTKNYLQIYFWRTISLITGFLSILVVVPHLSDNKELYGIYTFCLSFTLYLTYSDIGFLSAGQKYAAEEYARGNRDEEMKILGFTGAVLLTMVVPFSLFMLIFFFHPEYALSDISTQGAVVARDMFLILGLLFPVQIIVERLVQSILIIRIRDYISLRIDIIINLIKILSVFFFFSNGKYLLVQYFLFITILSFLGSVIKLVVIKKSEEYNLIELLKSFRFSRKYYNLTKKLAFGSLALTIAWIIYYEVDLIIIGRWFGAKEVAIYAIGLTFLNFLRTLWNTVFSPYSQRFNHFIGIGAQNELKKLVSKIVTYTLPLCIITTIVLVLGAKYLVLFWVGPDYYNSVIILQILVLGTMFGFVNQPTSYYLVSGAKYKFLYLLAVIVPSVFLFTLVVLGPYLGVDAVAIAKTAAMVGVFIISLIGLSKLIDVISIIKYWSIPVISFSVLAVLVEPFLLSLIFQNLYKSSSNLIMLLFFLMFAVTISYVLILLSKKLIRNEIKSLYHSRNFFSAKHY